MARALEAMTSAVTPLPKNSEEYGRVEYLLHVRVVSVVALGVAVVSSGAAAPAGLVHGEPSRVVKTLVHCHAPPALPVVARGPVCADYCVK